MTISARGREMAESKAKKEKKKKAYYYYKGKEVKAKRTKRK